MARLISVNKAIKAVYDFCDNEIGDSPDNYLIKGSDVLKMIEALPTVDDGKIIRCSECVNHADEHGQHYCRFWCRYCPDDSEFFCKAGERKDGTDSE